MNRQDIYDLYEYNDWANQRLLRVAAHLTAEQFTAPSTHSFGSLQRILAHTMDAERMWRRLLSGEDFRARLNLDDFTTVDMLATRWTQEQSLLDVYLHSLTDADLAGIVRYEVDGGIIRERVRWHCLFHLVNHGMQHRSEAAHLLTQYGHSPDDIDFTVFLNERKRA
jgi:uncharacterized damage-inducible protein DinB